MFQTEPNEHQSSNDKIDTSNITHDNSHLGSSTHSVHGNVLEDTTCAHCQALEAKIQHLEQQIIKLGEKSKDAISKNQQRGSSQKRTQGKSQGSQSKRRKLPFDPTAYQVDLETQRRMLKQLEEQAQRLKQKEKKQRKILKQLMDNKVAYNDSMFKKIKDGRSPTRNKTSGIPITNNSAQKAKDLSQSNVEKLGDEFEDSLNEMMAKSKLSAPDSEKSDLSSSITSEKREMIESMTPEEREAYYSKNMKNRKMMAKQKKHKRK